MAAYPKTLPLTNHPTITAQEAITFALLLEPFQTHDYLTDWQAGRDLTGWVRLREDVAAFVLDNFPH